MSGCGGGYVKRGKDEQGRGDCENRQGLAIEATSTRARFGVGHIVLPWAVSPMFKRVACRVACAIGPTQEVARLSLPLGSDMSHTHLRLTSLQRRRVFRRYKCGGTPVVSFPSRASGIETLVPPNRRR